jgi:hypothetical protein
LSAQDEGTGGVLGLNHQPLIEVIGHGMENLICNVPENVPEKVNEWIEARPTLMTS